VEVTVVDCLRGRTAEQRREPNGQAARQEGQCAAPNQSIKRTGFEHDNDHPSYAIYVTKSLPL